MPPADPLDPVSSNNEAGRVLQVAWFNNGVESG